MARSLGDVNKLAGRQLLLILCALALFGCEKQDGPVSSTGASGERAQATQQGEGSSGDDASSAAISGSANPKGETSLLAAKPEELKQKLDQALDTTFSRKLMAEQHAAWQIVHGIMAFGPEFEIVAEGKTVKALEWLLAGGRIQGWTFAPAENGLRALVEPGGKMGQGHPDQWLGYLNHCALKDEQPLTWDGKTYQLKDLIRQCMADVHEGQEASWTLMGLAGRIGASQSWKAQDGSEWNIAKLVQFETGQDLSASACGGTHRLYGLNHAFKEYIKEAGENAVHASPEWEAALAKMEDAVNKAKQFQDPKGRFSENYFDRPSGPAELDKQLGSTGHVLEFLAAYLDDKRLREPWVERAALFLCRLLEATKDQDLECGALYHAAHGLRLYRERLFGARKYAGSGADSPAAVKGPGD